MMSVRINLFILILFIALGSFVIYRQVNQNSANIAGITAANPAVFPNPTFTPGDVFSNAAVTDVCTPGYTKTVRNVSSETKKLVFEEYGLHYPPPKGEYEVDHFIPLELGGSNEISNLWPEPAEPLPGFHQKDEVENYLHSQVCSGIITLPKAQEEIRTNWLDVYQNMPKN